MWYFQVVIEYSYLSFGRKTFLRKSSQISQKLSTAQILSIYSIIIEYNTTLFQTVFIFQIKIIQEKVNKCVFPKSKIFSNKTFQTLSHDKLINQAAYQHTRQITLISVDKFVDHVTFFAHRLHCTVTLSIILLLYANGYKDLC